PLTRDHRLVARGARGEVVGEDGDALVQHDDAAALVVGGDEEPAPESVLEAGDEAQEALGRLEVAPVEHQPARVDVAQVAQVVVGGVGAGQPDDELPADHGFETHWRFEAHAFLLRRIPAVMTPTPASPTAEMASTMRSPPASTSGPITAVPTAMPVKRLAGKSEKALPRATWLISVPYTCSVVCRPTKPRPRTSIASAKAGHGPPGTIIIIARPMTSPPPPARFRSESRPRSGAMRAPPTMVPTPKRAKRRPTPSWSSP